MVSTNEVVRPLTHTAVLKYRRILLATLKTEFVSKSLSWSHFFFHNSCRCPCEWALRNSPDGFRRLQVRPLQPPNRVNRPFAPLYPVSYGVSLVCSLRSKKSQGSVSAAAGIQKSESRRKWTSLAGGVVLLSFLLLSFIFVWKTDKEALFIEKEVCALATMVTYVTIGTVRAN